MQQHSLYDANDPATTGLAQVCQIILGYHFPVTLEQGEAKQRVASKANTGSNNMSSTQASTLTATCVAHTTTILTAGVQ